MILVAYLLLLLKLRNGGVIHPLVVQENYLSYFIINMSPHLTLNDKSVKQFWICIKCTIYKRNSTYWSSVKSVRTYHGSGGCHWYPRQDNVKLGVYKLSQGRHSLKYFSFFLSLSLHQHSTFIHSFIRYSIANSIYNLSNWQFHKITSLRVTWTVGDFVSVHDLR
jgi:hypothetical protein